MSQETINRASAPRLAVQPALESASQAQFQLGGEIGRRLDAVTKQWILPAPFANPSILEMFRNRERQPFQDPLPWGGEYAGKYLTHGVQIFRLTRDPALEKHLKWFVSELISLQAEDGYLGPFPRAWRLKKGSPACAEPWDAWGHYHIMLGLILFHQTFGDEGAFACARRMGDLLCNRFLNNPAEKLHDTGAHEMNAAPIHSLCLLHELTGETRYLDLAHQIEKEFEIPPAGDYLRAGLAGTEFFKTPKPRWESLHPIMGLSELYLITGDAKYRTAFEHLWWSMLKGDRHNNGGFTSGEQATGDPYSAGAIETCCTIAWMAMSVEMLRLSGNSIVADEIELSLLNSGLGLMSPSGRWVTYDTPMNGQRLASAHSIVFQARAASSELNCCAVNGPRALGMISAWGLMNNSAGLTLNYYGPGTMSAALASGNHVSLRQETDYPISSAIKIDVAPERAEKFELALRIPYWSGQTKVAVNGTPTESVKSGAYLRINREWKTGDRISIELDFRPHVWVCEPSHWYTDWDTEWTIFGTVPNTSGDSPIGINPKHLSLDSATTMPASLEIDGKTSGPIVRQSIRGQVDLRAALGMIQGAPTAYLFTEIDSPTDTVKAMMFSAEWWAAIFVNGVPVFDTYVKSSATGMSGNAGDPNFRRHRVALPLKKGKNLIGVRVTSGAYGWRFNAGFADATVSAASIYRGPILLTYDARLNEMDPNDLPAIDLQNMDLQPVSFDHWLKPWMLFETTASDGRRVRLCDFASAGSAGNVYLSWLPTRLPAGTGTPAFSKTNPLRSVRL